MEVEIIAPVLTESGLLELAGLAPTMELTAPATENMAEMLTQLGFPTPSQLLDQQYAFFQIGGLIDLLAMVCAEVTETAHSDFRFTVTDNAGQQTTVTLQYAKTIASAITPGAAYNDDANFWTNTATLACVVAPEDFQHTTVEYKRTDGTWQAAVKGTQNAEDGTFTATISSAYNADNTMISETGIRPATDTNTGSSSTARRRLPARSTSPPRKATPSKTAAWRTGVRRPWAATKTSYIRMRAATASGHRATTDRPRAYAPRTKTSGSGIPAVPTVHT